MPHVSMPGFGHPRRFLAALATVVLAAGSTVVLATSGVAAADTSPCPDANVAAFGPNVCVFSPGMSQAAIQADLNNIAGQQVPVASQFNSQR
jgi:hypothetical protein